MSLERRPIRRKNLDCLEARREGRPTVSRKEPIPQPGQDYKPEPYGFREGIRDSRTLEIWVTGLLGEIASAGVGVIIFPFNNKLGMVVMLGGTMVAVGGFGIGTILMLTDHDKRNNSNKKS